MWDLLKKAEIEQAKQELKLRRAETLRRHAEENQNLDGDRLELETLYRLVDVFAEKFMKAAIVSHAPIAAPAQHNVGAKTSHEPRHHQHHRDHARDHNRNQHQTVFATFVRAASRH
jgi:hypothetical protein